VEGGRRKGKRGVGLKNGEGGVGLWGGSEVGGGVGWLGVVGEGLSLFTCRRTHSKKKRVVPVLGTNQRNRRLSYTYKRETFGSIKRKYPTSEKTVMGFKGTMIWKTPKK